MRFKGKAIFNKVWVRGVIREVFKAYRVGYKGILNIIKIKRTITVSYKDLW